MPPGSPSIFEDIREVVRLIPPGRVTSYGAIARYLGIKSVRMVGWALAGADGQSGVPAHRVVNASGVLTGANAFDPAQPMHKKLETEGVQVSNNKVKDFREIFWDPSAEL